MQQLISRDHPEHISLTGSRSDVFSLDVHRARDVLEALCANPVLDHLYSLSNHPSGTETVGEHTEAVMNQLFRYSFAETLKADPNCAPNDFALIQGLIAFHDLEKYPEIGIRNSNDCREEHNRAERWLVRLGPNVGMTEADVKIARTLLHSEAISDAIRCVAPFRPSRSEKLAARGLLSEASPDEQRAWYVAIVNNMQDRIEASRVSDSKFTQLIERTGELLIRESETCGIEPKRYLRLATVFYQCDCSTYTVDSVCEASGRKGGFFLDFLWEHRAEKIFSEEASLVYDHTAGRLLMRGALEETMSELEKFVMNNYAD